MTAIVRNGRVVETTQHNRRGARKTNQSCLMITAGFLVVGATLAIVLSINLAKPTDETRNTNQEQQQLMVQEDPYSIGCYADDRSSRVMPYVFTNNMLTPSVSGQSSVQHMGGRSRRNKTVEKLFFPSFFEIVLLYYCPHNPRSAETPRRQPRQNCTRSIKTRVWYLEGFPLLLYATRRQGFLVHRNPYFPSCF